MCHIIQTTAELKFSHVIKFLLASLTLVLTCRSTLFMVNYYYDPDNLIDYSKI